MSEPKETTMHRIKKTIGRLFGREDEAAANASEKRAEAAAETLSKHPRDKVRALVTSASVAILAVALGGCASFPRLRLELGAFGVTAALDTREMTNEIGDVAVALKDLVLPRPPETAAAGPVVEAPTVPVPEPVK